MAKVEDQFVFGVDLDGVCADFYGRMREIAAEWKGVPIDELTQNVSYNLPEWGLLEGEYPRLHRFAVTQRNLFETIKPLPGAPQSIRRLGTEGVRIRIITHRLFIRYFHQVAVSQTVNWLDGHSIPYWDLCFMREKGAVGADLYIEDTPDNIKALRDDGKRVIIFDNSTNHQVSDDPGGRAHNWKEAERMVRGHYYSWLDERGLQRPPGPGLKAPGSSRSTRDVEEESSE
jgi:5'(3')-deoxyribonucleotidase